MSNMKNAAPRVIFNGINDQSRGQNTPLPETFAQHTPLLHLFTETGPEETTYVGSDFSAIFGGESLNRRGKYFNMQSLMAERLLARANGFFVKRLKPDDAGNPARVTVAIDIVEDDIERTIIPADGFDYPGSETPAPAETTEMVAGYRARLTIINNNDGEIGSQEVLDGTFVSERDGTQSQIYPLFEMPAAFFGSGGDLNGFSMWPATTSENLPFDESVVEDFTTRIYRMMFKRKSTSDTTPITVKTRRAEEYVDICFTPGVYSTSSDLEFYAPDVLIDHYEDDGVQSGTEPRFSPFGEIYVYQDNIDTIQAMVYAAEITANPLATETVKGAGHIDLFTGVDVNGDDHHALLFEGPLMGGTHLGIDTVVYASGGADGTLDLASYEQLVRRQALNFGELGDQYEDINRFPFSKLYDSGLSMDGKYDLMQVLAKRPDIKVAFTTYIEAENRAPSLSEEVSRTRSLMTRLRAFPESVLYGTEVCRAEIIQQTGKLSEGGYSKAVPQILDYLDKWAQFAGASNSVLRETAHIDEYPNNVTSIVNRLSVPYINQRTQSEIWDNGGIYSSTFDRRSNYYPAIRSVYADDTSILLSPITVAICCHVMRIVFKAHAHFSGNARLTPGQLRTRCDEHIVAATNGLFGGRVEIRPETFHTQADEDRGFSWHTRVTVYGNNPSNVMTFELETRRMEELNNG